MFTFTGVLRFQTLEVPSVGEANGGKIRSLWPITGMVANATELRFRDRCYIHIAVNLLQTKIHGLIARHEICETTGLQKCPPRQ